jgi:hypothetical protein
MILCKKDVNILKDILEMYKDQPDSKFELIAKPCDSSLLPESQTEASMKAVAEHVNHVSLSSREVNEVLIEFLKEKCISEQLDSCSYVTNGQELETNTGED